MDTPHAEHTCAPGQQWALFYFFLNLLWNTFFLTFCGNNLWLVFGFAFFISKYSLSCIKALPRREWMYSAGCGLLSGLSVLVGSPRGNLQHSLLELYSCFDQDEAEEQRSECTSLMLLTWRRLYIMRNATLMFMKSCWIYAVGKYCQSPEMDILVHKITFLSFSIFLRASPVFSFTQEHIQLWGWLEGKNDGGYITMTISTHIILICPSQVKSHLGPQWSLQQKEWLY